MLKTRKSALQRFLCGTAAVLLLSGCASYVNIPADEGDTALNAVNIPPVPGIMAYALSYAANQYPTDGAVALALPAPAGTRAFEVAMNKVGRGAAPWAGMDDARATYRVLSVRVRGSSAIVDVLLPDSLGLLDGKYLLEINLSGHFNGWSVIGVKRFIPTAERMAQAAIPMGVGPTERIRGERQEWTQYPATEEQDPTDAAADPMAEPSAPVISTDHEVDEKALEKEHVDDGDKLHPIRSVPPPKNDDGH